MKASELYNLGQPDIPPGNDFKTPPIPKVEINMNSDPNPISNTPKNGSKTFPWKTVCVFGLVLLGTYLFLQIPPDENYRRRRR